MCPECVENRNAVNEVCLCIDGMWDNAGECEACGYPCKTCSDKWSCIECNDIRGPADECPCPYGYFELTGSPECYACSFRCAVCERDADNCTECADSRLNAPYCDECPEGKFDDGIHVDC